MKTPSDASDLGALAGQIDGANVGMAARNRAARDFGGVVNRVPAAVVNARSADHERQVIIQCGELGIPITIQGIGGSVNGQSLSSPGILLRRSEKRPAPVRFLDEQTVEISARSRWWDVETRLAKKGVCIPVLADFLGLTVGGTLSVGGYGFDSIRHGPQVDLVERLSMVLPNGDTVWCSPTENAELFSYALAGLGQVGLIDKVVMQTMPRSKYTVLFNCPHRSMMDMVRSFEWMADGQNGPAMFKGLYSRGRAVSTYGVGCDSLSSSMRAQAPVELDSAPRRIVAPGYRRIRSLVVSAWVASFGRASRVWVDYILDYAGLLEFTSFLSGQIEEKAFGNYLRSVYILGIRRRQRPVPFPLEASGAIDAPVTFGVGLYSMVPRNDPAGVHQLRATHRTMMRKCIDLGGRPYLYGMHEFDEEIICEVYGDDYPALQGLRETLDPDSLFQRHKLLGGLTTL